MKVFTKAFLLLTFLFCIIQMHGQEELRWQEEVDKLSNRVHEFEFGKEILVLSGSSSARLWSNISEQFPDYQIVNTGFGGSQMHELLYFIDDLIIRYKPEKVLIYEGDNDIGTGKSTSIIMKTTKKVVSKIKADLPDSEIYFISPKPSLARWDLKQKYIKFNTRLRAFCDRTDKVYFIDVWYPMLNEESSPLKHLFVEDGLHMNAAGYDIWATEVGKALKK